MSLPKPPLYGFRLQKGRVSHHFLLNFCVGSSYEPVNPDINRLLTYLMLVLRPLRQQLLSPCILLSALHLVFSCLHGSGRARPSCPRTVTVDKTNLLKAPVLFWVGRTLIHMARG